MLFIHHFPVIILMVYIKLFPIKILTASINNFRKALMVSIKQFHIRIILVYFKNFTQDVNGFFHHIPLNILT